MSAGFVFRYGVRGEVCNCAAVKCEFGFVFRQTTQSRFCVSHCMSEKSIKAGFSAMAGAKVTLKSMRCEGDRELAFTSQGSGSKMTLQQCESVGSSIAYDRKKGGVIELVECVPKTLTG